MDFQSVSWPDWCSYAAVPLDIWKLEIVFSCRTERSKVDGWGCLVSNKKINMISWLPAGWRQPRSPGQGMDVVTCGTLNDETTDFPSPHFILKPCWAWGAALADPAASSWRRTSCTTMYHCLVRVAFCHVGVVAPRQRPPLGMLIFENKLFSIYQDASQWISALCADSSPPRTSLITVCDTGKCNCSISCDWHACSLGRRRCRVWTPLTSQSFP